MLTIGSEDEIVPFKNDESSNQITEKTQRRTKPTKKQRTKKILEGTEEQKENNTQKRRKPTNRAERKLRNDLFLSTLRI